MAEHIDPRHTAALATIDTRFYSFRGAWGAHEAIIVDTTTGQEYEILNRDHLKAPWIPRAVTAEQIQTAARVIRDSKGIAGFGANGKPAQHFSRQCFNHGLGYDPVHI